jgi:ribosomal protein L35AE/L33A
MNEFPELLVGDAVMWRENGVHVTGVVIFEHTFEGGARRFFASNLSGQQFPLTEDVVMAVWRYGRMIYERSHEF